MTAAVLGASLIETHVVFSRDCFGPDVLASITIQELSHLVEGIRFVEASLYLSIEEMIERKIREERERERIVFWFGERKCFRGLY